MDFEFERAALMYLILPSLQTMGPKKCEVEFSFLYYVWNCTGYFEEILWNHSCMEIKNMNTETNFTSEEVFIRELDYYYTNSISRSSKTMSECRQINVKLLKTGTIN